MPHNHPPRCCCPRVVTTNQRDTCPSCVEHGELAQLSKPHAIAYNPEDEDHDEHADRYQPAETMAQWADDHRQKPITQPVCPSCHTPEDRPHTDYCQYVDPATGLTGRELPAVDLVKHLRASVHRAREARAAQAQTSQPNARTSQPPTQTRGAIPLAMPKCATCPRPVGCPPGQCDPTTSQ